MSDAADHHKVQLRSGAGRTSQAELENAQAFVLCLRGMELVEIVYLTLACVDVVIARCDERTRRPLAWPKSSR
jgi:hypothetical protein